MNSTRKPANPLSRLGWDAEWERIFAELPSSGLQPARVAVEGQDRCILFAAAGEVVGRISGRLRHHTASSADLPKVGDWVAITPPSQDGQGQMQYRLPRRSQLIRKVPGRETEAQVLAVNVDLAFIVQALDRTFNPRLLERFLYMAMDARVQPVVALNKADVAEDLERQLAEARAVAGATPILVVSARTGQAVADLRQFLAPGRTVVFLGASGVGKSSLINRLYGENVLATTAVRETDDKGRHTTSWRELIVLDQEGVVIDTPGLREFQLWLTGSGLSKTFADIETLAVRCHFRACSHTVEKGCAVLAAIQNGAIDPDRLRNFQKLKGELDGFSRATQWQQPRRPRSTGGRAPRHSDFERKNRRHFPRPGP